MMLTLDALRMVGSGAVARQRTRNEAEPVLLYDYALILDGQTLSPRVSSCWCIYCHYMGRRQQKNPYQSIRLLLDGRQRLTLLAVVIGGEPVNVRGLRRPIELLFNLEHPDELSVVILVTNARRKSVGTL